MPLEVYITWDAQNPVNNGINYQPRLVFSPDFFPQETIEKMRNNRIPYLEAREVLGKKTWTWGHFFLIGFDDLFFCQLETHIKLYSWLL